MYMKIEQATLQDIPALCHLLEQLFRQEVEFNPDQSAQQRGLQMIIENPQVGTILIARKEGLILGMVNLLYTVSTALGERVLLLEDMVVDEEQRAAGIGSRLLDAALAFSVQNGCRRITLLTDADNAAAHRFYQRHGFNISSMVVLRCSLD
jgi:GNAT superfamily N-acetyltransferase